MTAPLAALVVDDDLAWRQILTEVLQDAGLVVEVAASVEAAVEILRARPHRVAVLDLSLEGDVGLRDQSGLRILDAVRLHDPGCVPILLTGFATVDLAVSALTRYGAFTVLQKDTFRRGQFAAVVRQALAVAPVAEVGWAPGVPDTDAGQATGPVGTKTQASAAGRPDALVVEDDAGWRSLLGQLLVEAGYNVRACRSYGEALGYLRREQYVLTVVDLSLASSVGATTNQDGAQVLACARDAKLPAIVVSGSAAPADVDRAYTEQDIFAYLQKQAFDKTSFLSLVREAARHRDAVPEDLRMLTPRELDVLALVAEGLTNKDIAASLVVSTNTVKRYLKSIFAKLEVDTRAAAAARALRAGLGAQPPAR